MGVIALKQCDPKHHLSLLSDDDYSVKANADLPFEIGDIVFGSSCEGLVYYMGRDGEIVVCNLTTREFRVFAQPSMFSSALSHVELDSCGLGYDSKSGDYKLVRTGTRFYTDDELSEEGVGRCMKLTELYSFKSDSWKLITEPDATIMYPIAVYVGGSCYWTAVGDCLRDGLMLFHILKFDLATESFSHLHFPQSSIATDSDFWPRPAVYRGSLAALVYSIDRTYSCPSCINFFVRRGDTWEILFDLKLESVERPLGFGESPKGSILFLEGLRDRQTRMSELMVYDFHSKKVTGLGIYERATHMSVTFFDFKETRIPDSTPMAFVDNIVQSSGDVEEMKAEMEMKMKRTERKKNKKKVLNC